MRFGPSSPTPRSWSPATKYWSAAPPPAASRGSSSATTARRSSPSAIEEDYAPLRRGTVATVRSPSLSQVAGRQVQLTLPPDQTAGEEIDDGGVLTQAETVSEVDLDQVFNTLDPETIEDFKHVIQGFELSYDGVGKQANKGLRYLNPFLSTSRRVFAELSADQAALENLLVDTAQFSGALASRSGDLSALVANLDQTTNAIGDRSTELAEAISLLPDFMREANTTFVNLRAALSDLDPLVTASRPAARELGPFLAQLRAAAADAVPTIRDLDAIAKRPGKANDLVELTALQPALAEAANGAGSPECGPGAENADDLQLAADDDYTQGAFGESLCALENGLGALSFFRAYAPEALGWFNTFSHIGSADGIGDAAVLSITLNAFSPAIPLIPDLDRAARPERGASGAQLRRRRPLPRRQRARPRRRLDPVHRRRRAHRRLAGQRRVRPGRRSIGSLRPWLTSRAARSRSGRSGSRA